jgi:hypothetical protein
LDFGGSADFGVLSGSVGFGSGSLFGGSSLV